MDNIKDVLFKLSNAVSIGNITCAADIACDILSKYAKTEQYGNNVIGRMSGNGNHTLMLEAHIDEVGFIVTDIDSDGFLTVKNCGGIDLRMLPARQVTIHGKQTVKGVFCSTPPHLAKGTKEYDDIADLKIDTLLGGNAKDVISVGDYVTFCSNATELLSNRVTGKSFDNRAGVTCLLEVAKQLSRQTLPFNIVFAFTDAEELGHRGAKTVTFDISPDEAIVIDVSFGNAPDVSERECGNLSEGAMIGLSPVLDKIVSKTLIDCADKNGIPYQTEVMGDRTGTNGDTVSLNKNGVKTVLLSIPIRNMHTPVEVVDITDIENTADLIVKYVLKGEKI